MLDGTNSRLNDTGEWINELGSRVVKVTTTKQKERIKRNKDIKCPKICTIGFSEG